MKRIFFLLCLLSVHGAFAQGSGNVLSYNGVNQYISLGSQVSDNCRTIEMWFKCATPVNASLPDVKTLIARDYLSGSGLNSNEFGFYFSPAPWSAANAGRLVFYRRVGTTGYWVYSNNTAWQANVWYHVAGVIDPTGGMKMYVNGVLQTSTDPSTQSIQIQTGSPTDDITLATWGNWGATNSQRFFDGEIDEVRFWLSARTQAEVRENMCRKINPVQANLRAYYRFDANSTGILSDLTGNGFNGTLANIPATQWHYSSAPIGDTSTYVYTGNWTAQNADLLYTPGDQFIVSNISGSPAGVHIYRVASVPNMTSGLNGAQPMYYGVFLTGTNGTYDIYYDYSAYQTLCTWSCTGLSTRNDNAMPTWVQSTPVVNNCSLNKTGESTNGPSYREEYILDLVAVISSSVLGNDTIICSAQQFTLSAYVPGATFLWNTGDTTSFIQVGAGTYWIQITSSGCTTYDTVTITNGTVATVSLGSDTVLCPDDLLTLTAPSSAASYLWSDGTTDNSIDVTGSGSYWVVISNGFCNSYDTIDVAFETEPELGSNLTYCEMPPAVALTASNANGPYLWSTGDTAAAIVVNSPGLYWISTLGHCNLSDTITITSESASGIVFIPNSFTPNGDGKNEMFRAEGTGVSDFHMEIFNRWGEFIFESYEITSGWDGTYQDSPAQEEVYVVRIEYYNTCENRLVEKYAHIALIR